MSVPISNVSRRQVYAPSGAGGAGPYAFTFEILANTDIAVYKDDTLLTLTTHYTVTINANGTGSVTITAAGLALSPTSPTQYAIVGNRTIARSSDFTTGGDFFANTLNDELDQQTIFAQQNAEGIQRALSAPQTDPTSINMTLPRASVRAGKYLSFDNSGNPVAAEGRTEVSAVYAIRDDIVAVSAIDDQVVAVAANSTNINTVATNIANVNSVGGSIASVNTVAGELGAGQDVTVVAANLSGTDTIGTVAGSITNVNNVGGSIANVNTVAGSISNVNTNATNIANINENAANIVAIQNASLNAGFAASAATFATTQANNAAASAAAASAVALGDEPVRPAIRPSLLLDFANTKQLDPRITFTRASTATYYGTQTAKAEENLLVQSQDFTTTWTQSNLSRTANTTVAPDGTTTADTLTDTTDNGAHIVSQSPLPFANTVYTLSCFLKANTHNFAMVTLTNTVTVQNGISAVVNLSTGVITQTATGTNATAGVLSSESIGNGWVRVVITGSSVAGFNRAEVAFAPAATGNTFATNQRISFTGTGTASFFAWGAQLEQRSAVTAYTATTTQTITNYIPQMLTVASGVPRFDHNPITFESLGLEIEESRTNLVLQSETFATTWAATAASITSNAAVSPAGTLTADTLIADTTFGSHIITQSVTTTAVATTFSIYAKAAGQNFVVLQIIDSASLTRNNWFNLSTGTVGTTGSGITASMVSVGNGWYRCAATISAALAGSNTCGVAVANADAQFGFNGNDFSGIFIWGAQVEAGAFATSYIPTVASQVTRAADSAVMTGTNFSSWYNQAQGTLYAEGFLNNPAVTGVQNRRLAEISDGSNNNKISFGRAALASDLRVIYTVSGVNINGTNGQVASSVFPSAKVAVAYKAADYAFSPNGASVTTSTASNVPVVNRLDIGNDVSNGATGSANGTIKKIAYYPLRVTNAQLQAITTV